ncbi:MAG: hypothetical protein ACRCVN_06435 [Spirochaetia bacterium]
MQGLIKFFKKLHIFYICTLFLTCSIPGSTRNWTESELSEMMTQGNGLRYVGSENSAKRTPAVILLNILFPMAVWALADTPATARAALVGGMFNNIRSIQGGVNPKIILNVNIDGSMGGSYIILKNNLDSGRFYSQTGEFYQEVYRY